MRYGRTKRAPAIPVRPAVERALRAAPLLVVAAAPVFVAAVATVLGAACGTGTAGGPDVAVRDSAGVEIVESEWPVWPGGGGITIDPDPILDLAGAGSAAGHEFYGVVDAIRLEDGTIVVAETGGTIRYFDPAGDLVASVGGEGEGPGEFLRLRSIEAAEDGSLMAFDPRTQRVTFFGPDRELSRVVPLASQFLQSAHLLGDDALVVEVRVPNELIESRPGHVRPPVLLLSVTPDGRVTDTLATTAGPEAVRLEGRAGVADARPLFGMSSHVEVWDDRLYVGDADGLEFRVHAADGRLERIVRVPDHDLALTDARLEAEIAARFEINDSPRNRQLIDMLPVPAARPGYADLVVDSEGMVWLEEHTGWFHDLLGETPRSWEVFDPDGAWRGTVTLPAPFDVFEIGPDYVLGLWRDETRIEHPRLLRLIRP